VLEEPESRKDVNVRTAQLVQLITELGPDIPEIARRLGQFKESVRYRYKEKILNKGFAVQAAVDHEKLGLRRTVMLVDFEDDYAEYAATILTAMSQLCYVVSFAKELPRGKYVVNLSVPRDSVENVRRFFGYLKERGMFRSVEIFGLDWMRNPPMKAEFYDFDSGRWDFDWTGKSVRDYGAAAFTPSSPAKYDVTDLLLMRELQKDANKSLKEISDELKLNYKKLAWHYNTHVVDRQLLRGYRVNWMGTRYDFKIEKALHRMHRYLQVALFVTDVSEVELAVLRQRFNQIPFLWAEAGGKNYYAELAFPVDYLTESLKYVADTVAHFKDRAEMLTMDQTNAASFTIAPELYNEELREWTFNVQDMRSRFENLIQEIKKESG
jgi:DNA-binding Lrp family transcriptional regulator